MPFLTGNFDITGFPESSALTLSFRTLTTGSPDFKTFTLDMNGLYSKPIGMDASESEIREAVMEMFRPECPGLGEDIGRSTFLFK